MDPRHHRRHGRYCRPPEAHGSHCCCHAHGGFRRRFQTREEIREQLEHYREELRKEIQAVEEKLAHLE